MKKLVVGLGNPGPEYKKTRHNIGFMLLDKIAENENLLFKKSVSLQSMFCEIGDVIFLKPMTYMNKSGQAVIAAAKKFNILPENILVVCDDLNLSFSSIRIRLSGSAGGHNGLKSIIEYLGTQDFPRIKYGIGRDHCKEVVDYVLSAFTKEEFLAIAEDLTRMQSICLKWKSGEQLRELMNEYNVNVKHTDVLK